MPEKKRFLYANTKSMGRVKRLTARDYQYVRVNRFTRHGGACWATWHKDHAQARRGYGYGAEIVEIVEVEK